MSGHTIMQTLLSEAHASLREHVLSGEGIAIRDHGGVRYAVKAAPRANKLMPGFKFFIDGKRVSFEKFTDAIASQRVPA